MSQVTVSVFLLGLVVDANFFFLLVNLDNGPDKLNMD
jgi:hypothetical protein